MPSKKGRAGKQPFNNEVQHEVKFYPGLQCSTQDVYARMEREINEQQIPGLTLERIDWPEGGVLSPMREYLRATREQVVLDICAAPFGTGFFISFWCSVRPPVMGWPAILVLITLVFAVLDAFLGLPYGLHRVLSEALAVDRMGASLLVLIGFVVLVVHLIGRGRLTIADIDSVILRIPYLREFYLRYLRRVTYYRVDQGKCYVEVMQAALGKVVGEVTERKGIDPFPDSFTGPILKKLY